MSATSARTGGLDRRTSLASWHSPLAAAEGSLGIAVEEKDEPHDGPQMRTLGDNPVHRRLDKARAGLAA